MRPGGDATSRMTASDDTVFPDPDSPTMATTSAGAIRKLTWSTTVAAPSSVKNSTDRSDTASRSSVGGGAGVSAGRVTVVMPRRPLIPCFGVLIQFGVATAFLKPGIEHLGVDLD